ncbi:helix-turn-helix domain-containing protein [Nocardia niigatensis]
MSLDPESVRQCRYAVAEVIRSRRRIGVPIPAWLRGLHERLDLELQAVMSGDGPESEAAQSDSDLVSAPEASALLGCSARHVRRLAADLGGRRIGREWVFTRAEVVEYARARKE